MASKFSASASLALPASIRLNHAALLGSRLPVFPDASTETDQKDSRYGKVVDVRTGIVRTRFFQETNSSGHDWLPEEVVRR
ncbi:hypothetical protein C5Y93_24175 [Blastopirellula marina]|uniref:Uncharacterized protein n=1 Tax=Blastopirellula marina TaxID=124 RepID=A0A2S8GH18_9BACT|nr:hypothetical protein C5Y93_24175 [Blastopirellula marina]